MVNFKFADKPLASHFGKYPRSLQEAFKGMEYGAAIEVPYRGEGMLKGLVKVFPKVIWVLAVLGIVSVIINAI